MSNFLAFCFILHIQVIANVNCLDGQKKNLWNIFLIGSSVDFIGICKKCVGVCEKLLEFVKKVLEFVNSYWSYEKVVVKKF